MVLPTFTLTPLEHPDAPFAMIGQAQGGGRVVVVRVVVRVVVGRVVVRVVVRVVALRPDATSPCCPTT